MNKLFVMICISLTSLFAAAKISNLDLKSFKPLCSKMNKGAKNLRRVCACEELNFKWLIPKEDWKDFKKIYSAKKGSNLKIKDELEAVATVIFEVSNNCSKKSKYVAPKARMLMMKK